jgi:hypothetical protein
MGEITEIVELYIEDSDILEDKAKEISVSLEDNIKNVIGPGSVGYDTGHLHDSVVSNYAVSYPVAVVIGWYGADYGQYWYRWKGGVDFLQEGLEQTIALYGE